MKKKLNFIDWLRKQTFTDVSKKSLIDKHVGKIQKYVNPENLLSGNMTDINVARMAKSIEKLPHEEREQRQQELMKMQQQTTGGKQQ